MDTFSKGAGVGIREKGDSIKEDTQILGKIGTQRGGKMVRAPLFKGKNVRHRRTVRQASRELAVDLLEGKDRGEELRGSRFSGLNRSRESKWNGDRGVTEGLYS